MGITKDVSLEENLPALLLIFTKQKSQMSREDVES